MGWATLLVLPPGVAAHAPHSEAKHKGLPNTQVLLFPLYCSSTELEASLYTFSKCREEAEGVGHAWLRRDTDGRGHRGGHHTSYTTWGEERRE